LVLVDGGNQRRKERTLKEGKKNGGITQGKAFPL
jgi:hypothetical protein